MLKDIIIKTMNELKSKFNVDESLLLDEGDGTIFYMNGRDSTPFDWEYNERLCEFVLFYKKTELGCIKLYVYRNGNMNGYFYDTFGKGVAQRFECDVVDESLVHMAYDNICDFENFNNKKTLDQSINIFDF